MCLHRYAYVIELGREEALKYSVQLKRQEPKTINGKEKTDEENY